MASAELATGLNYLTDAAHLLRNAAPKTSAHLMSQRASLLHHHDMAVPDLQRQHVCAACGHIMIPGQGDRLKLETQKALRRKGKPKKKILPPPPAAATTAGPCKVLSCGFCGRHTKIDLPAPERVTRRKVAKTRIQKTAAMTTTTMDNAEAPKPATANASSKKRAKNRKTGLQALLSGQQQRQSNPLSLADFMMK